MMDCFVCTRKKVIREHKERVIVTSEHGYTGVFGFRRSNHDNRSDMQE